MKIFARILVPYDASEPAGAALAVAIALAKQGAALVVVTVVDETNAIGEAAESNVAFDPQPLMDALDADGNEMLDGAAATCRAAGVTATFATVHDRPVSGIVAYAEKNACDLIVMGTHARSGVARTFLGSTTDGVLRLSSVPVLAVRLGERIAAAPFASLLVGVDDSEPADLALAVAAALKAAANASVTACSVVDMTPLYQSAANDAGVDTGDIAKEMRDAAATTVRAALARAGLPADTPTVIAEGDPAGALVTAADGARATAIVCGTHGRRGIRRLVLGSVAERLVRISEVPVLVIPEHRKEQS